MSPQPDSETPIPPAHLALYVLRMRNMSESIALFQMAVPDSRVNQPRSERARADESARFGVTRSSEC